jgi:hypothetical protein
VNPEDYSTNKAVDIIFGPTPVNTFVPPPKRLSVPVQNAPISQNTGVETTGNSQGSAPTPTNVTTGPTDANMTFPTQGKMTVDLSTLGLSSPTIEVKRTDDSTIAANVSLNNTNTNTVMKPTLRQTNPPVKATPAPAPAAPQKTPEPMGIPKGGVGTIATVVVDRIMKSEGKTAIQSGRKEYFGFREGNPGFKELTNSISKFGIDSQETKQLVTTLLTKRAKTVGADKFSDPSVQASILSIAHMRGEGGAQAILNSVAGAPIKRSAKLTNNTVDMINSMSPSEFQDRLRQVRETYDKQIYGDKTDSITRNGKTVTGKWWDLFGKGLTSRYDMERQEFLKLSPRMAQGLTTAQLQ